MRVLDAELGLLFGEGADSSYSLMAASKGVYGEAAGEWSATDALGFSKIVALAGVFHRRAGKRRQLRSPPRGAAMKIVIENDDRLRSPR